MVDEDDVGAQKTTETTRNETVRLDNGRLEDDFSTTEEENRAEVIKTP